MNEGVLKIFLGKSDLIFQSINANAVWKTAQKYTVKGQVLHISQVTNIRSNSHIQRPSLAVKGPCRGGQTNFWAQAEQTQKLLKKKLV